MKYKIIVILLAILPLLTKGQNNSIDSLKQVLKNTKHDTARCIILNEIIESTYEDKIWYNYNNQLKKVCESNLKKRLATKHLHHFYSKFLANALNNIGIAFHNEGNISSALDYCYKSLKIREEINDEKEIEISLSNIGFIYQTQKKFTKALEYYQQSLKIRERMQDKLGIAYSLNNIGVICHNQGKLIQAIDYYNQSLNIYKDLQNKEGVAIALNNIGYVYYEKENLLQALNYYQKSLKIKEELKDKYGIATSLNNIVNVLLKKNSINKDKNRNELIKNLSKRILKISEELGYPENIKNASRALSDIYSQTGDWKNAYKMYVLYKKMSDSIINETSHKASVQKNIQYEYEKKAFADSTKALEAKKVNDAKLAESKAKLKQEKTLRYSLFTGLALVLIFAGFIFNRFKKEEKQKKLIESQKETISKKNHEINESIDYALHIQSNILPHFEINKLVNDGFILYQPKDVVSGDFYWLEQQENLVYIVLADCTGHGIPGAFMSMLGTSLLNEIFNKHEAKTAATIISKLNTLVKLTFKLHLVEEKKVNDGMDIAFCILNKETLELQYAGANRPLWLVKNNELQETKANKQAIGGSTPIDYEYTNHTIQLQKGDSIYLTSDGYADQFGGAKGKKMMTKVLKEKLIEIQDHSMAEQKTLLANFYTSWKGENEQVDDVSIIGIRV